MAYSPYNRESRLEVVQYPTLVVLRGFGIQQILGRIWSLDWLYVLRDRIVVPGRRFTGCFIHCSRNTLLMKLS